MKRKKIIATVLAVCMLATFATVSVSCGLFKKKIDSGTEAAKLLLANDRLDEETVGEKIGAKLFGESTKDRGNSKVSQKSAYPSASSVSLMNSSSKNAGQTWKEFPNRSHSMVEFNQFLNSIEQQVSDVSQDIVRMKKSVGITDKWVKVGDDLQMLRVYEKSDVLFVKDSYSDVHVYYRYTDENAKNVYEMFSFMSYEDGTTGEIRTMSVPGERYEYMYNNSNGFTDYFIGENSRGYWMNTRFNYYQEQSGNTNISFSPYIVKDGLGLGAFLTMNTQTAELTNNWYSIFDPINSTELFRVRDAYNRYEFDLYFSAIRDGFVSVSANDAYFDSEENVYQTSNLNRLTTTKGTYTAVSKNEQLTKDVFQFTSGYVQYDYGENIYYGSAEFTMDEPTISLDQACLNFGNYANLLGLTLKCDMETVARSLSHAKLLAENFGESFTWNNYKLNEMENVKNARNALQKQFDDAKADYQAIKDYEVVSSRQILARNAHFAQLDITAKGNNTFVGKVINCSGLSVSTEDVALFEQGQEYILNVGLSLVDENGEPVSTNTIPLSGGTVKSELFSGSSITLTANGQYQIPENLDRGKYAVVVYASTKEDGIRVSKIEKLAFVTIAEGEIDSSAMHIQAIAQEENLILKYEIKNSRQITIAATKELYTYEEIKRFIMVEILAYGAPYYGASLEYQSGEKADEGATLGKGLYRMTCYLMTENGLVQSYVYLTLE